jgi:YVTN family beta-propeller protein
MGSEPYGIAVSPDGKHAYVTCNGTTIGVGANPRGVAVAPHGKQAYVVNQASNTVSVISAASNTVTATIALPAGSAPSGVGTVPP